MSNIWQRKADTHWIAFKEKGLARCFLHVCIFIRLNSKSSFEAPKSPIKRGLNMKKWIKNEWKSKKETRIWKRNTNLSPLNAFNLQRTGDCIILPRSPVQRTCCLNCTFLSTSCLESIMLCWKWTFLSAVECTSRNGRSWNLTACSPRSEFR